MNFEKRNEVAGKQGAKQPATAAKDQKSMMKRNRKEKRKKMIPVWILLIVPVIIFVVLLPLRTSQVQNDTTARIHKALSEYPGLLEDDYSVSYEYYLYAIGKSATTYVAMARVTFHCKEGARLQSAETDKIKNIFLQDTEPLSILGSQVKLITPVTLAFKDGTSATFCQNAYALSDNGQNGGIINAEYYEPSSPPMSGFVASAIIAFVCWASALVYYKKKIKITNE